MQKSADNAQQIYTTLYYVKYTVRIEIVGKVAVVKHDFLIIKNR